MLYVDHVRIPFGRMLMNHLMADTPEELREAAEQLGLSAYITEPGNGEGAPGRIGDEAAGGAGHGGQAGHGKGAGQPGPGQEGRERRNQDTTVRIAQDRERVSGTRAGNPKPAIGAFTDTGLNMH